jgi:hypothetical protein
MFKGILGRMQKFQGGNLLKYATTDLLSLTAHYVGNQSGQNKHHSPVMLNITAEPCYEAIGFD